MQQTKSFTYCLFLEKANDFCIAYGNPACRYAQADRRVSTPIALCLSLSTHYRSFSLRI